MATEAADTGAFRERLRRIEAVTDSELARFDLSDLLPELLDRVRELLGVDTAAVLLLDSARTSLVATAARGIEEEVQQGVRVPLGRGFAGRIAAQGEPAVLDEVTASTVHNPLLIERGIRSMLGVPLFVGGTVLGVLHVGTLVARRFTEDDITLLQLVADRIALATQARLSRSDRAAATALQRSLLPTALPATSRIELAARYVAGEGEVGGDWYDVFALPGGLLGIVMGDVAGHGLTAAVAMGRLRTVFRAHALDILDPAALLTKVDQHIRHFEQAVMTTGIYAVLDPSSHTMQLAGAGHPPPLLARPGRPAEFLDLPRDLPLGVAVDRPRHTITVSVPPGTCLCFYTDGLVERRDASLDTGLERLRHAMTVGPAESVCAAIMSRMVGRNPAADDIAILTVSVQLDASHSV